MLQFIECNWRDIDGNYFFLDFLSESDEFLNSLFESIENSAYLYELSIFKDTKRINRHNNNDTITDLLICILLAINKFYLEPSRNVLLTTFYKYNSEKHSNCFLLESLLKFFNFEGNCKALIDNILKNLIIFFIFSEEPLECFKIKKQTTENEFLITNSVIKFLDDIFSIPQHIHNIFYLGDFQIIIDIIIRKLLNLSCDDQVAYNLIY